MTLILAVPAVIGLAPLLLAFRAGLTVFGWGADVTVAPKDKTHALHD